MTVTTDDIKKDSCYDPNDKEGFKEINIGIKPFLTINCGRSTTSSVRRRVLQEEATSTQKSQRYEDYVSGSGKK